ncbi:MAG: FeoB-associated Cys-rich membrane protein [Verrucomicrobiota bacterium]|nr:FeoB-associated Cys-rich membrane protein [Verrucomicrobiota bacterium]
MEILIIILIVLLALFFFIASLRKTFREKGCDSCLGCPHADNSGSGCSRKTNSKEKND